MKYVHRNCSSSFKIYLIIIIVIVVVVVVVVVIVVVVVVVIIIIIIIIALGYGLDDRSSRVRFPAGAGNFSLHHRVQTGSGAHPASYPIGTRGPFPRGKAAGA
jgi:hypothetical protein